MNDENDNCVDSKPQILDGNVDKIDIVDKINIVDKIDIDDNFNIDDNDDDAAKNGFDIYSILETQLDVDQQVPVL